MGGVLKNFQLHFTIISRFQQLNGYRTDESFLLSSESSKRALYGRPDVIYEEEMYLSLGYALSLLCNLVTRKDARLQGNFLNMPICPKQEENCLLIIACKYVLHNP